MGAEPRALAAAPFSGSYDPADVTFLLKPVLIAPTPVAAKEALIQSGRRHYSEMIAPETPPGPDYLRLYQAALARNRGRLAEVVASMAAELADHAAGREIVLVSLARAGTPIGILLLRTLRAWGLQAVHYSISIIRDRGIDLIALAHIAARHEPNDAIFIDGWTGKGAIAHELRRSLADRPFGFAPRLAVIADPAGQADIAACCEDYLIPSGLLNGIVSGLVSRSVLSAETVGPGDFHACIAYPQFAAQDLSRAFIDAVAPLAAISRPRPIADHAFAKTELRAGCGEMLRHVAVRAGVRDPNRIKPGIAEATRALLRRVPERLFVRDPREPDVEHLIHLAELAGLIVERLPSACPYRAVAVIRGSP
jgi:hypothetical protein